MKRIILMAGMALYLGLSAGHAQIIYTDTFNRTGALNGSSPTINNAPGAPVWNETDTDIDILTTNGSAAVINNISDSSTAMLPLTLAANTQYYAQVTIAVDQVSPAMDPSAVWAGVGFTAGTTPPGSGIFNNNSPVLWAIQTDTGTAYAFNPAGYQSSGANSAPDTLTFLINTGSGAYSITDSNNVFNDTGTLTTADINSITGFSVGDNVVYGQTLTGNFSELTIGTGSVPLVPEPSCLTLFLLGFFGLVTLLRFRNKARDFSFVSSIS